MHSGYRFLGADHEHFSGRLEFGAWRYVKEHWTVHRDCPYSFYKGFLIITGPPCCPFQLSNSFILHHAFRLDCLLRTLASGSLQAVSFYLYRSYSLSFLANESYFRMIADSVLHSNSLSVAFLMLCYSSCLPSSHLALHLFFLKTTFGLTDVVTVHILYKNCTIM